MGEFICFIKELLFLKIKNRKGHINKIKIESLFQEIILVLKKIIQYNNSISFI